MRWGAAHAGKLRLDRFTLTLDTCGEELTDRAFRAYIWGLMLAAEKRTDGVLLRGQVLAAMSYAAARPREVAELYDRGLWVGEDDGSTTIASFFDHGNQSREALEARREGQRAYWQRRRDRELSAADGQPGIEEPAG